MAYSVTVNLGAGPEDVSAKLAGRYPVTRFRGVHALDDPCRPVVGTARFALVRDNVLINRFLSSTSPISVTILKDGVAHFKGQIRDTHRVRVGLMRTEAFEVECVDAWMRLEKTCTLSTTWANYQVSNPAVKASSLLHQLFYAAGFADAELNLAAISTAIDRAVFDLSKSRTYRAIIEGILSESGYSARVDAAGVINLYDLGPTSITPVVTLSSGASGNIAEGYDIERQEARAEAVEVKYWSHQTLASQVVFEDTSGGDKDNSCNISLAAGAYHPSGADASHDVRAVFSLADREIVAVDSPAIEWAGVGVAKQVETIDGLAMRMRFYSAAGGTITKLRVRGTAIVRGDEFKVIRENVANTEKCDTRECEWITATSAAERLAIILANWHSNSRFTYTLKTTSLSLSPGDYVTFNEAAILGAVQTLRIISIEDGADPKAIKIVCEGASAYSYSALPRSSTSGQGPAGSLTLNGANLINTKLRALHTRSLNKPSRPTVQNPTGWQEIPEVGNGLPLWRVQARVKLDGSWISPLYPTTGLYPRTGLYPCVPSRWSEPEYIAEIDVVADAAAKAAAAEAAAIASANASVPSLTPKYLGKFLDSAPTAHVIGDIYCRYSATSGATYRGVFKWSGAAWARTEIREDIMAASADISFIIAYKNTEGTAIYGTAADYTSDSAVQADYAFFQNAFIGFLEANGIKVRKSLRGGDRFDDAGIIIDDTKNGTFMGADGKLKANNADITGAIKADSGTFKGSLLTGAFDILVGSDVANWTAPVGTWAGSVFYTAMAALPLGQETLASGTFDGKAVESLYRNGTYGIYVTAGGVLYVIRNNSTLYSYQGNIDPSATGSITLGGDIIPSVDAQYDLGSFSKRIRTLYSGGVNASGTIESGLSLIGPWLKGVRFVPASTSWANIFAPDSGCIYELYISGGYGGSYSCYIHAYLINGSICDVTILLDSGSAALIGDFLQYSGGYYQGRRAYSSQNAYFGYIKRHYSA